MTANELPTSVPGPLSGDLGFSGTGARGCRVAVFETCVPFLIICCSARSTHDARCFGTGFYLIGKVNGQLRVSEDRLPLGVKPVIMLYEATGRSVCSNSARVQRFRRVLKWWTSSAGSQRTTTQKDVCLNTDTSIPLLFLGSQRTTTANEPLPFAPVSQRVGTRSQRTTTTDETLPLVPLSI